MANARRRAAVVAAALLVLAVLGVPGAAAQGAVGEVEVRVAAQRLADGRTEFALQERESDGSWAARRLPSARFFPANADVGRWLSSSPLTVEAQPDSMLTATAEAGVEVRVVAQLLADGRMEFALQERESDGSWGARRLPAARFFPANAGVGRWLSSSALTVRTGRAAAAPATAPTPAATCVRADSIAGVMAATFQVQTATGSGTAFYIGNGEWITNHHVVETADRVALVHGPTRLGAQVVGSLPSYDLALLRAQPPASVRPLGIVQTRPPLAADLSVVGFPVYVSGTPSVTSGVVSKHAPPSAFTSYSQYFLSFAGDAVALQHSAAQNPGNSGGPIVDDCGEVVGVSTFGFEYTAYGRPVEGISFGIAAETVTVQLPNLRSARHYARRPATAPAPAAAALSISAFCNREAGATLEACRVAGAGRLLNDQPRIFIAGVSDYYNVRYSVDEGGASEYLSLRTLGRGQHALRVNELRSSGWTGWSAPYAFTVTGAAPLEIPAVCNGAWADYDTSDACFAAGSGGILADSSPVIWTLGVAGWDNVRYSVDGGPASTFEDLNLRALAAGFHTIRASEQQAAGWTGWSEPYAFTITGAAPIEITAICNRGASQSNDECLAAGANGLLAERRPSIWRRGTLDAANDRYSVDGGPAVSWGDFTLRDLVAGRHQVRLSEQQAAGWTGWTEPYWFTIIGAAPLVIQSVCGGWWDDYEAAGDCIAASVGGVLAQRWLVVWTLGVHDWDNVVYSIDGGEAVVWDEFNSRRLPPGYHTIRVGEEQPAGWSGWSEAHVLTIAGAAPLHIVTLCDRPRRTGSYTQEECEAAEVTQASLKGMIATGALNPSNVRVSLDGGAGVAWDDFKLQRLPLGRHNIRIAEQQTAGWTGWSEPYWFTIRE